MHIPSRMLLRLKKSIKVPKRWFDKLVGGHFCEAKIKKDLTEFRSHLEEGVEVTTGGWQTKGIKVEFFKCGLLVAPTKEREKEKERKRKERGKKVWVFECEGSKNLPSLFYLAIISEVKSVSSFSIFVENLSPFSTLNVMIVLWRRMVNWMLWWWMRESQIMSNLFSISCLFFNSLMVSLAEGPSRLPLLLTWTKSSRVWSTIDSTYNYKDGGWKVSRISHY